MTVNVYGKKSCGLCEATKEKLNLMGIGFTSYEISDFTQYHEGWREDESVEVQACYADIDTLPVVTIDGKAMSYSQAMKMLKGQRRAPVSVASLQEQEQELVAV